MKRATICFGLILALTGCDDVAIPGLATAGGDAGPAAMSALSGGAPQEYLVLGSSMGFEECRARGGIIIRDQGSPMVACDPRVRRQPVPADEFDHPGSPVPQTVAAEVASTEG